MIYKVERNVHMQLAPIGHPLLKQGALRRLSVKLHEFYMLRGKMASLSSIADS